MSALQGKSLQHQVGPSYLFAIPAVVAIPGAILGAIPAVGAILQYRLASLLWSARLVLTFHEDTCFN